MPWWMVVRCFRQRVEGRVQSASGDIEGLRIDRVYCQPQLHAPRPLTLAPSTRSLLMASPWVCLVPFSLMVAFTGWGLDRLPASRRPEPWGGDGGEGGRNVVELGEVG